MKKWLALLAFVAVCAFSGWVLAHDRVDEIIKESLERSQKAAAIRERSESKIERLHKETGAVCVVPTNECAQAAEVILSDRRMVKALKKISSQGVYIYVFNDRKGTMTYIGDDGGLFIPHDVIVEQLKKYLGIR